MAEERVQLPGTYESMYQNAQSQFRSGDLDAGVEILQRILKRLGTLSQETLRRHEDLAQFGHVVGLELAGVFATMGRYDEAVEVLESLDRYNPETADEIERRVGLVLVAKGDLDEAISRLSSLTERFPYDPLHWLTLGEAQAVREAFPEAEASLEKALELATEPAAQALINHRRFLVYRQQGRTEEALEAWDQMAGLRPDLAQRTMGQLYTYLLETGDVERLRRYLQQDSSSIRADYYRGVLDNRAGDFAAGTARWRKLLERNPLEAPQGRVEWAEAALRIGQTNDALALLIQSSEEVREPRAHLLLAIGMVRLGEVEDARRTLESGIRMLRAEIPRRTRYSRSDWELFTSLTDNRDAQSALKELFETEEAQAQ